MLYMIHTLDETGIWLTQDDITYRHMAFHYIILKRRYNSRYQAEYIDDIVHSRLAFLIPLVLECVRIELSRVNI